MVTEYNKISAASFLGWSIDTWHGD